MITSKSESVASAHSDDDLMTVVEVVPLVAGTAPVIVRCGVVGAVVGVLRLLVQSTGLGVLNESLGVQVGCLLAVEDGTHSSVKIIRSDLYSSLDKRLPSSISVRIINHEDINVNYKDAGFNSKNYKLA